MAVNVPDAGSPIVDSNGLITKDWYPVIRLLIDQANAAESDLQTIEDTTAEDAFAAISPTTTRGDLIARGATIDERLPIGAAGQVLTSDGVDPVYADPAVSPWTSVFKTADESTSTNTVLFNDAALAFPIEASTKYAFRMRLIYETPDAADFKFDFTGPAAASFVSIKVAAAGPGLTTWTGVVTLTSLGGGGSFILDGAGATTEGYLDVFGIIHNGVNAGTVHFQWAQNSSSGTTTVYAGSYIEFAEAA